MFAPAGTPKDDHRQAQRRHEEGRQDRHRRRPRSNQLGVVLKDWTPEQFNQFVATEGDVWSKIIKENKITLDE
jgi:tripartite-type tricarboxylate transporter receptor subunit TctC